MNDVFLFTLERPLSDLEAEVREQLASSFSHIAEQVHPVEPLDLNAVENLCAELRSHQVDPLVFARYHEMLIALQAQKVDALPGIFERVAELTPRTPSLELVRFGEDALGTDVSLFRRIVFSEDFGEEPILDPGEDLFQKTREDLHEAFELIEAVAPEAAREIRTLWTRIYVGTTPRDGKAKRTFAGVTSFLLWGSSFMNAEAHRHRMDCADYLIHEITHATLFTMSAADPLVLNDISERYPSPLRRDLRPMDGIYHATLVSGRLYAFFSQARTCGCLRDGELQQIEEKREGQLQAFRNGVATVREFGRLSDLAQVLLDQVSQGVDRST